MKWFYNMKIGAKLISSFLLVALLAGIIGIVGVLNLKNTTSDFTQLWKVYGIATADVGKMGIHYQQMRSAARDVLIDPVNREKHLNNIKEIDKKLDADIILVEKNLQTENGRKALAKFTASYEEYKVVWAKVLDLVKKNQEAEATNVFYSEGALPVTTAVEAIDEIFNLKVSNGDLKTTEYNDAASQTIKIMVIIVAVAILVAMGLGLFIAQIIGKPVKELVGVAEKIADGDLDIAIEVKSKDEIGILASAFKRMTDNLNEVMMNINSASEQVAAGSRQVSASSMALSQGATEQASSIEELTASIEEISSQTKLNAENVAQLNVLAEVIQDNSVQGNGQMKEMLTAMEEINDASNNISKIIKVIDEIAFQTNILALNAAVEAARAGQHGKGFAVVAEEVRNLAARSANAAKETTDLIEGSIKKVEGGTRIANQTATALDKIVEGVSKAGVLVNDIAVASSEQATGIAQVTQGIAQVSQVVQTNSATSEESAAASEELSGQAELLREQVGRFKLRRAGSFSYGEVERISPEVLRMLESMSDRKKLKRDFQEQGWAEAAVTKDKPRIALSDHEFGKY
jgi:methyl-accepting chemotaxis protein